MKREAIETGRTIDEAIEKACQALGLTREEVSIEVLETPQKKLFKTIPAKVKASVGEDDEPAPAPVQEVKAAQAKPAPAKKEAPKAEKQEKPAPAPKEEEVLAPASGEKAEQAVNFLKEVISGMGIAVEDGGVTVEAFRREQGLLIKVNGSNVGALIGRHGEVMEALSYLTSLATNRAGGEYEKINIDIAGYRSRREDNLAAMAQRVAKRVAKSGKSQTLEPMNPYERRIVHSAVSEIEGAKSESYGEGAGRRIVITCTDETIAVKGPAPRPRTNNNRGGQNRGGNRGGRGGERGGQNRSKRPAELKEHTPVPIAQEQVSAGARPGAGPDEELLGKLGADRYGKIDL